MIGLAHRLSVFVHEDPRSQRGTEVTALFYSITETCKLVGANPYDYLRDATHAALKRKPVPMLGDRDHAGAARKAENARAGFRRVPTRSSQDSRPQDWASCLVRPAGKSRVS